MKYKKTLLISIALVCLIFMVTTITYAFNRTIANNNQISSDSLKVTSEKIGYTYTDLLGGEIDNISIGRMQETNLGNLIGDAIVDTTKSVVNGTEYEKLPIVGIQNAGGIKTGIPKGNIYKEHVINMLPYNNVMTISLITPKKLYEVLENSVSCISISEDGELSGSDGRFLQVSGVEFIFDPSKQPSNYFLEPPVNGNRILAVHVDRMDSVLDRNDDTSKILLCSNDYLMKGEDGYTMLSDSDIIYIGDTLCNVVAEFIKKISNNTNKGFTYNTEGRIQIGHGLGEFKKNITLIVEDELLKSPVNPVIEDYKVMIPMRVLFEHLGWEVIWHEENTKIEAINHEDNVFMQIGNDTVLCNNIEFKTNPPVKLIDGHTMISIDIVEKILNMKTCWDSQYAILNIY